MSKWGGRGMIYVLSALVLLSPLLFTLLLASDLSVGWKVSLGFTGLALLVIVPIVVFLVYGGGSISGSLARAAGISP